MKKCNQKKKKCSEEREEHLAFNQQNKFKDASYIVAYIIIYIITYFVNFNPLFAWEVRSKVF